MNVCVFCAATELEDRYVAPAKQLARLLAEEGHTLIWGGSNTGIMKVMADGVSQGGGRVVGISMEKLRHVARENADEMIITKDHGERKAMMLDRADIVVAMVGGLGTLDEAAGVLEYKKHGLYHGQLIFFDIDNFYEGLSQQLHRMEEDGFLPLPLSQLAVFADSPTDVIKIITRSKQEV